MTHATELEKDKLTRHRAWLKVTRYSFPSHVYYLRIENIVGFTEDHLRIHITMANGETHSIRNPTSNDKELMLAL